MKESRGWKPVSVRNQQREALHGAGWLECGILCHSEQQLEIHSGFSREKSVGDHNQQRSKRNEMLGAQNGPVYSNRNCSKRHSGTETTFFSFSLARTCFISTDLPKCLKESTTFPQRKSSQIVQSPLWLFLWDTLKYLPFLCGFHLFLWFWINKRGFGLE